MQFCWSCLCACLVGFLDCEDYRTIFSPRGVNDLRIASYSYHDDVILCVFTSMHAHTDLCILILIKESYLLYVNWIRYIVGTEHDS